LTESLGVYQATRLSTHERQQEKIKKRIEQLEKSNLDPKHWTLQGEITAAKRPKNSALEVELDFEHAVRPAPVITEEVTASLEDIIRSRIIEVGYLIMLSNNFVHTILKW
jgi:U3 small nucleolar RNA-associated protein MPP10